MKRASRWFILIVVLLGLVAVVLASIVVVDESAFGVVTNFGRVVAVYGDDATEAGPHFKSPWQRVIAIDKRLKVFEPPAREVITGDKRNLEVAAYLVWRVADPVLFLRAAASDELAEARLNERIAAALSDAIGRRDLAALASTDLKSWALDDLTREVANTVAPAAAAELGVLVLDIRLRRFNHPVEVRPAVFELIRSERRQVAAKTRAEGEAQYVTITSQADRARDTILAQAEAEAQKIRSDADAEATRVLNESHQRDPRFYEFLRTLDSYRSILDDQTTLILSGSSPLLKLLSQGPPRDRSTESQAAVPPIQKAANAP